MALSDYDSLLRRGIESHAEYSTERGHKRDVAGYYREHYGKQANRRAAEDLYAMGVVRKKNGERVGVESLMRRFQSRGGRSQGETNVEYQALASRLPSESAYPQTVKITIDGKQSTGEGGSRDRSFTVTLTAAEAKEWANHPDMKKVFEKLKYPPEVIERFEDGTYKLTITAIA